MDPLYMCTATDPGMRRAFPVTTKLMAVRRKAITMASIVESVFERYPQTVSAVEKEKWYAPDGMGPLEDRLQLSFEKWEDCLRAVYTLPEDNSVELSILKQNGCVPTKAHASTEKYEVAILENDHIIKVCTSWFYQGVADYLPVPELAKTVTLLRFLLAAAAADMPDDPELFKEYRNWYKSRRALEKAEAALAAATAAAASARKSLAVTLHHCGETATFFEVCAAPERPIFTKKY